MGLLVVIVEAVVQAVTAVLPIGSLAHRLLIQSMLDWPRLSDSSMLAIYIGMTLALAAYFWRDVAAFAVGVGQIARGRREAEARLLLFVAGAAIPLLIVGFALRNVRFAAAVSPATIGGLWIGFGILLFLSDRVGVTVRRLPHMSWGAAFAIGLAQIAALIPGVGRSAIAVTMARLLGFERAEAARFSLLLALPTLLGAIALTTFRLAGNGAVAFDLAAVAAGIVAFFASLATVAFLMSWLESRSFALFALYRVIGGAALLTWLYVV